MIMLFGVDHGSKLRWARFPHSFRSPLASRRAYEDRSDFTPRRTVTAGKPMADVLQDRAPCDGRLFGKMCSAGCWRRHYRHSSGRNEAFQSGHRIHDHQRLHSFRHAPEYALLIVTISFAAVVNAVATASQVTSAEQADSGPVTDRF